MRKNKTLILLIYIILAVACRDPKKVSTDEMIDFVSADGDFKASFPCKPVKSESRVDSKYGNLPEQVFSCKTESGTYSVSYRDYPSIPENTTEIYDVEKDRLLREYKNELEISSYNIGERNGLAAHLDADDSRSAG